MEKNKIKFVRKFERYGANIYEVIYYSGRVLSYYGDNELTKTAKRFMLSHKGRTQPDYFHGEEVIYK